MKRGVSLLRFHIRQVQERERWRESERERCEMEWTSSLCHGVRVCLARACKFAACTQQHVRACVRVCMRACARACVHACMRAWVCVCVCARACACVLACVRACVRACMRACVRACVRACMHSFATSLCPA